MIPSVDLKLLESVFGQLDLRGVKYDLGAKADSREHNPLSNGKLTTPVKSIQFLDCSGFTRYALAVATGQQLLLPDGSQNQLAWCMEQGLHRLAHYSDVNAYMTARRLFIAFIRPNTNGAGDIGHVWLVAQVDGDRDADTMESHGGKGVDSRAWNYATLRNQVYAAFELPVK